MTVMRRIARRWLHWLRSWRAQPPPASPPPDPYAWKPAPLKPAPKTRSGAVSVAEPE